MIVSRLLTAGLATALMGAAVAGPLTYAGKTQRIRVGVVLIESQNIGGSPFAPTPHTWGQLDRDRTIKPANWSFVNPRAQTTLTTAQQSRWLTISNEGDVAPVGSRISKRNGAYWEVDLDEASAAGLAEYDALLLPIAGLASLNPSDREKLRRFVDAGGLLWVDLLEGNGGPGGPRTDAINNLPIPFQLTAGGGTLFADRNHPLLNTPNALTVTELNSVLGGRQGSIRSLVTGDLAGLGQLQATLIPDSLKLQPVVGESSDSMAISLGRVGEGFMLVTSRGTSRWLNGFTAGGAIDRSYLAGAAGSGRQFGAVAKIVVNAIQLANQYSSQGAGGRRTGSLNTDIPAPLGRSFDIPGVPDGNGVAVYNGRIVLSRGGRVEVYDLSPRLDRDGNGNPDDGAPDTLGSPTDLIWQSPVLGGQISSPTVGESVRGAVGDVAEEMVFVTNDQGQLIQLRLANGAEVARYTPPQPADSGSPQPPVIHEGLVYMSDAFNSLGRVWVVDLAAQDVVRSTNQWALANAAQLGRPSSGPTLGYIPILDNSGGMDKVLYFPTLGDTNRTAGFASIWLGARGEAPRNVAVGGGNITVVTRAAENNLPIYLPPGGSSLGVKVSVIDANGEPYSATQVNGWFNGTITPGGQNGILVFGLTGAGAAIDWTGGNHSIRLDYTLDWGAPGFGLANSGLFIRGDIQFPDDPVSPRQLLGNLAMAPNGNLFAVTAPEDGNQPGGTLWCIRESGRGNFNVLYRYEFHDAFNFTVNAGGTNSTINYDGSVVDYDGLLDLPFIGGFLNRAMTRQRPVGGATVRGDTVYVAMSAQKDIFGFGAPTGAVLAFNANPEPMQFEVEGLTNQNFVILQPDYTRSANRTTGNANQFSVLQQGQFTFDRVEGSNFGRLRFPNAATTTRGRIRDAIAANLPIVVRVSGRSDILVEPELGFGTIITKPNQSVPWIAGNADGKFNPLRWQSVFNGVRFTARPFVAGDNMFFGGASILQDVFNGTFPPTNQRGLIYALDTRIAPNDLIAPSSVKPFMSNQAAARTWSRYLSTLNVVNIVPGDIDETVIVPSRYIQMPNPFGIRTFGDLRIRVLQASLDGNDVAGLVGGEGRVVAWGGGETYVFNQGNWVIADEGRVIKVDTVGNPIWSTDSTGAQGLDDPEGVTAAPLNLIRPTRVYGAENNRYLIADPTANRIAEIDNAGRELRSFTRFKLDPAFRPDGVADNITTNLALPSDVTRFTSFVAQANNPFTNPQPDEYWEHTVIADTANGRVIELVDRYQYDRARRVIGEIITYSDPNSARPGQLERAIGVLRWQIPADLVKRRYAFNSIAQSFIPDGSGGVRPIYAFSFGNREATPRTFSVDSGPRTDNEAGSGGVVIWDPANGQAQVVTGMVLPAIDADVFWNDTLAGWSSAARPGRTVPFRGVKSATIGYADFGSGPQLSLMVTDNTGVYELSGSGSGNWQARWFLPREAFVSIRTTGRTNPVPTAKNPADFQPTYARRLESGEIVVVNGYVGRQKLNGPGSFGISPGDPYGGEVIVLSGDIAPSAADPGFSPNKRNLGFDNFSVRFELPPIQGVRGLVAPTFADRR